MNNKRKEINKWKVSVCLAMGFIIGIAVGHPGIGLLIGFTAGLIWAKTTTKKNQNDKKT